jgi:hypothetical protein
MKRKGYFDLMLATFLIIFIFIIFLVFSSIVGLRKTSEKISEDLDKKARNYVFLNNIVFSNLNDSEKEILKDYKVEKFYQLIYFYLYFYFSKQNENFKKNFENMLRYRLDSLSETYAFLIVVDKTPVFAITKNMKMQEYLEGIKEDYGKIYLPYQDKKIEIILVT